MDLASSNLSDLAQRFEQEVIGVTSEEALHQLKASYLGKSGHLGLFLRELGSLPPEERPLAGAQANTLKKKIEEDCRILQDKLSLEKKKRVLSEEAVDITLPGRSVERGHTHPISRVMQEVEGLFRDIGFSVFGGPEVETDFFNFEALNIPADHPARDMQDTFYLTDGTLLRTHTSPVQIHVMKRMKPPIRMIAPGPVYRRDSDISHTPMFHQVEGLVVDESVTFADLKGTLTYFLGRLFGEDLKIRLRPSYFPFTEPSAEVDIQCVICRGSGKTETQEACRLCKTTGWLEVMGCGMVHPAVFEKVGYDPKKLRGFAFGMGIERLAMLKYRVPDIRLFFENDLRFLKPF